MKVKLTDASLKSAFLSDVGAIKDVEYHKGVTLPYDVEVTLADDDFTAKSALSGAISKLVAEGSLTIVSPTTAISQMLSHAETSTAAQTLVTLAAGYVQGNRSLHVYIDGSLQPKPGMLGATYTETTSTTITFSPALTINKDVQCIWSK